MTDQTASDITPPPVPPQRRRLDTGDPVMKLGLLAVIAILTLIPTSLISNLVDERMGRQEEARVAVARSWGPAQALGRLALAMPTTLADGTPRYVSLAPNTLEVTVEMAPEQRRRGFFATTVYAATVHLRGTFAPPHEVRVQDRTIPFPERGYLVASLTGLNGAESGDKAGIDGANQPWQVFEESVTGCGPASGALVVPVTIAKGRDSLPFEADLHLRGTEALRLAYLARDMNVTVKGAWPSPSFVGDEPPVKTIVAPDRFEGRWHLDSLGRSPAAITACAARPAAPILGVDLVDPMPIYRMVTRAAKYGPLFVILAFTTYFVFELAARVRIGVLQYGLLAASLTLFALLLVSIGEFAGYTSGYIVAAALIVTQASVFTASVMRRLAPAIGFAALLSALFGFLYVLLGLENYALLVGTAALFLVLSAVMAVVQAVQRRDPLAV